MTNKEKINVQPIALQIAKDGPDDAIKPCARTEDEARQQFADFKPELYALTSILIDHIMSQIDSSELSVYRFKEIRNNNIQILGGIGSIDPFEGYAVFVQNVMIKYHNETFRRLESQRDNGLITPLTRVLGRYSELVNFLKFIPN